MVPCGLNTSSCPDLASGVPLNTSPFCPAQLLQPLWAHLNPAALQPALWSTLRPQTGSLHLTAQASPASHRPSMPFASPAPSPSSWTPSQPRSSPGIQEHCSPDSRSCRPGQRAKILQVQSGRLGTLVCWPDPSCTAIFKRTLTAPRLLVSQ